jgi:hypothetical protein
MSITWEEYQNAYKNAPAEIKAIIDSDELSKICDNIIEEHSLSNTSFSLIIGILSRIILKVIEPNEKVIDLLESLTISHTQKTSLVQSLNLSALNLLKKSNYPLATTLNSQNNILSSDIVETEEALKHLSTVRTMARDMHDLESQAPHEPNTHQSTQAATLNRDAVQSPVTPPTPGPRWDSAT